ncbi:MAG: hypothetical protein KDI63_00545 [Gammaproteobacteria bacterium]|nr:hypothetical protein [Gammaproteobacteria bacterium]
MKRVLTGSRGYSRLEIAFFVVLFALVGTLAVTKYLDISRDAKLAMEPGLIEGVRKGISEFAEEAKHRGDLTPYPPVLDHATLGDSGQRNLFFDRVLDKGVAVAGWTKTGTNEYRTPSGDIIVYNPNSGEFAPAGSHATPGNGESQSTQAAGD